MAPKIKFAEGDIVWAADKHYFGVYESKILNVQTIADKTKYFIHFQGWAAKYDTWVDEDYLAPHKDDKGLERLKTMLAALSGGSNTASGLANAKSKGRKGKSAGVDTHDTSSGSAAAAGDEAGGVDATIAPDVKVTKKRAGTSEREQIEAKKWRKALALQDLVDEVEPEGALKVAIPLSLKQHMVDEWGLITGDAKRLISLPRAHTVAMIIKEFLEQRKQKLTADQYISYEEFFHGFQYYFNKALPIVLLYRQEREQYDTLCTILGGSKSVVPSDIYGGEHVLRLVVKMNLNMSNLAINKNEMTEILSKLTDFVKFLQKNSERFTIIAGYPLAEEALAAMKSATPEQLLVHTMQSSSSSSSSLSSARKKGASVEEPVIISPTTGRPVRPTAGKNKYLEDDV
jgi:mortality factor 4-like protein 1